MSHQNPLQVSNTLASVSGTVQRWFSKCSVSSSIAAHQSNRYWSLRFVLAEYNCTLLHSSWHNLDLPKPLKEALLLTSNLWMLSSTLCQHEQNPDRPSYLQFWLFQQCGVKLWEATGGIYVPLTFIRYSLPIVWALWLYHFCSWA